MTSVQLIFLAFYFISIVSMMISEKIISILLSMELMMLSIFFFFYVTQPWFPKSNLTIIFLSFMVCESVLGLATYIYLSRLSGKDEFKSLNLSK